MKTYLEQLEQLERLPENHFCFEPVTGLPEVPISSRKPRLRYLSSLLPLMMRNSLAAPRQNSSKVKNFLN